MTRDELEKMAQETFKNWINKTDAKEADAFSIVGKECFFEAVTEVIIKVQDEAMNARLPSREEFYVVVNNGVTMLSADEMYDWLRANMKHAAKAGEK